MASLLIALCLFLAPWSALAAGEFWINFHEIQMLSNLTGDPGWDAVVDRANNTYVAADMVVAHNVLGDEDGAAIVADIETLARAYTCSRDSQFCSNAAQGLRDLVSNTLITGNQDFTLSAARNLLAFVIAADVLDDATANQISTGWTTSDRSSFVTWLGTVLSHQWISTGNRKTIREVSDKSPHNWGAHAIASRMAAGYYAGGAGDTDYTAGIARLRGFLGDRSVYHYDASPEWDSSTCESDRSWACPAVGLNDPVLRPINEAGCTIGGVSLDGAIPDDASRNSNLGDSPNNTCPTTPECPVSGTAKGIGTYQGSTPYCDTNYPYEALQGLTAGVWLAERTQSSGDPASWSTSALRRAFLFMRAAQPNGKDYTLATTEDDVWIHPVLDCLYQLGLAESEFSATKVGKNMAFTLWTHTDDDDVDGVPNLCDNCPKLANAYSAPLAFQTNTGGQLDDDADGWGNRCDGDFNQAQAMIDSLDFALFKNAFGCARSSSLCGGTAPCTGSEPCDEYDLNGTQGTIDSLDFAIFKELFGKTKKQDSDLVERCGHSTMGNTSTCPLTCTGDACP